MPDEFPEDLIVLVADTSMQFALRGILNRHQSLRTRPIDSRVIRHIDNDPGCLREGPDFLRPWISKSKHALLILDLHGCGRDQARRESVEEDLEDRLARSGWGERAVAIVIDPELEAWVWTESPHLEPALGWRAGRSALRQLLCDSGLWDAGSPKPNRPQRALDLILRSTRKRRTSALFSQLAATVSLDRCTDPAFQKLKAILPTWFPE
jgi:hypothetical protein